MPCDCLDPADYVCTGNGADLLVNTSLTWLLTTDGLIGTPPTEPEIPNGNINQLFWKLLQNDCAIANFIQDSFVRTYGSDAISAPAVDTIPSPLANAPATPVSGQQHIVFYNDFEVLYRYNTTEVAWEEVNRTEKVIQVVTTYEATVSVTLFENDVEAVFPIPTETDDETEFAFELKDLSLLYVELLDILAPFNGPINCFFAESPSTVRVLLSAPIDSDGNYLLKAIFRRTVVA